MIKKILLGILLLGIFLFNTHFIHGEVSIQECKDQNFKTDQECIDYLQKKALEKQGEKRTLSSQIAVMDSQIRLTEARISATKQQISELALDINTATKKIDNLEKALDNLTKVFINRIVATYKVGKTQTFEILLSSGNIPNFFSRLNYLKVARSHDKEIIIQTQQAKSDYTNQKDIFEAKKKRAEILKASLDRFTAQLAQERRNKQTLLEVTRNDEARYQQLLSQAQAELAIAFGGGSEKLIRSVKQGDVIGTVISGSSGCSSGTHLHFEVHKNASIEDASAYLQPKSIIYKDSESEVGTVNPRGSYPWPLNDPIYITQGYGMTPYAQTGAYRDKNGVNHPHYGIDMGSNSSLSVKAVRDGELYGGSISCGGRYPGTLLYAKVKHSDGIDTLYLHMIPN